MKYYSKLEFSKLDDDAKQEYYEALRAEKNEAITPDKMEEIASAYEAIAGYYNASEFARDLKNDAVKQRAANEKMRKEKRRKGILIIVGVLAAAVLIASITIIASILNTKDERYREAVELYENERYDEAKQIFETLGDYEKSKLYLMAIEGFLNSVTFNGEVVREGDEITIGSYDQDGIEGTEELKWYILSLDADAGRALVISKDIIEYSSYGAAEWENSEIRQWLNAEFFETAFSPEERAKIIKNLYSEHRGENEDDIIYEVADNVSLLSLEEYEKYMGTGSAMGSAVWSEKLETEFSLSGRGVWLMRTVNEDGSIASVNSSGGISESGVSAEENCGVRPIMWITLDDKS